MSNGIKASTIVYPDGEKKFLVTVFLDGQDSDWVEFDRDQFGKLVAVFAERLAEYDESDEIEARSTE